MSDINTITVSGRVGGEPEIKAVGDGTLATFSLAVNRWAGEEKGEVATWIDINLWGTRAKVAQYITKGMKLLVTGSLQINKVEGKDGGAAKYFTAINANDVVLPDRNEDITKAPAAKKGRSRTASAGKDNDGLPF